MRKIGILTSGRFGMSMMKSIVSAELTSSKEIGNIKFAKENSKAVNQDEEHRPSTTPVCNVRLPFVVIGVFREIKSLGFHASIWQATQLVLKDLVERKHTEVNIGQIHREPASEASSGREVDKPTIMLPLVSPS
jgi:hypothetical protein